MKLKRDSASLQEPASSVKLENSLSKRTSNTVCVMYKIMNGLVDVSLGACPSLGNGFFLACEDFGGKLDDSFHAFAFFFFKVEISPCTPVHFFSGQDQSTVAQRAETTVAVCFLTRCL